LEGAGPGARETACNKKLKETKLDPVNSIERGKTRESVQTPLSPAREGPRNTGVKGSSFRTPTAPEKFSLWEPPEEA